VFNRLTKRQTDRLTNANRWMSRICASQSQVSRIYAPLSQLSRICAAWGLGTQDPPRVPGVPELCVPVPGVPDLCGPGLRDPRSTSVPRCPGFVRPCPRCHEFVRPSPRRPGNAKTFKAERSVTISAERFGQASRQC
jgi:hypothetical protein